MKVGLYDLHDVCGCVSPHINFRMAEPTFIKLGMHIMAHEPIWSEYFIISCP
jgi:hypothetical protein